MRRRCPLGLGRRVEGHLSGQVRRGGHALRRGERLGALGRKGHALDLDGGLPLSRPECDGEGRAAAQQGGDGQGEFQPLFR
ncbi:hypothetical protein ACFQX4_16490 [Roseomonas sp. GCM10028921]